MKKENHTVQLGEQVKTELISYIKGEFIKEKELDIAPDYPLLEKGVIDSLSMMTLIVHIENRYNLDFYKIDVTRDRFSSINTIAHMILENIGTS